MKKKIILLLIGLLIPFSTNAAEVIVNCPETTIPGEEITCNININSSEEIIGFEADVTASTSLTYKSYSKASGWAGESSKSKFLLYGNKASGNVNLGSYTYKVANDASGTLKFTLSNFKISDVNVNPITVQSPVEKSIRIKSNIATLSSLTVAGATFDFKPETTTYNLEINSENTTISATATDPYASISGTGNVNLNYGANKFDIVVTAEAGTLKTYTINITRPDNRSKDNNLSSLSLSNGEINFDVNKTNYDINIDASTTAITATAQDTKSTVIGTGVKNLNYGVNKFDIVVTAENGTTKTYTINVTRNDNRDTNNYLSSLTTNVGLLEFNKDKLNYTLSVSNNIEEATITATAESTKAKLEGVGNHKLEVGENNFIIKVTAENETSKEYKLTIIREKLETITTNNNLKNLIIKDHNINFDSSTKDYAITTKENTLDITVELENSEATYEVIGNENLQDGSIIQIIVTDKEGNNNIYRLKISKPNETVEQEETSDNETKEESKYESSEEKTTNLIPIIMISLLIVLLIITIILFIRWKNNRKELKKKDDKKIEELK